MKLRIEETVDTIISFGEVLEAVETLSVDEQETLVEIVERRLAERSRQRIIADVLEARAQFARGECKPVSVDSLMEEILA